MTDLQKFIELYKGFGIGLTVTHLPDKSIIRMSYGDCKFPEDKIDGYPGFYSMVEFDREGKFIKQGFWE